MLLVLLSRSELDNRDGHNGRQEDGGIFLLHRSSLHQAASRPGGSRPCCRGSAPSACAVLLSLLRDGKPRCAYAWSKCGSHNSCAGRHRLFLAGESCLLMAAAGTKGLFPQFSIFPFCVCLCPSLCCSSFPSLERSLCRCSASCVLGLEAAGRAPGQAG